MLITPINTPKYQNRNNSLTFKAMKKTDFRGIDFAVVEKFKAPIERFDAQADFNKWAGELVEKIKNTNFWGRQAETINQRNGMLKDWFNYVIEENGAFTKAIQLLILSSITKNLGENDDNLPPTLNKGVLADCVNDLNKELEKNKKAQFDFNKMYQHKLQAYYLEDTKTNGNETKWIVIPSKEHDPVNFESNVEKLKTLSHKTWCTKSYNAKPYLSQGDFHVYLEDGEPKIGVRFIGDTIQEIQGELNNSKIQIQYFDIVEEHINKNNLELRPFAIEEIEEAEATKQKIEKIKQDLAEAIQKNDATKIYEYFGIKVEKIKETNLLEKIYKFFGLKVENNKKENLILSKYVQPNKDITYKDVGLDENELFKNVIKIKGHANFRNSNLKNLSNLESIGHSADFRDSQILKLGKLESIGYYADFRYSQITDLGNLKTIGSCAFFKNSKLKTLKNLESIGDNADFRESKLIDLGNLKSIGGDATFEDSNIINLNNLESIGGSLYLKNSKLKPSDFKNIKVGGKIC